MTYLSWRGVPIPDPREWAAARGERMVRYRAERKVPNGFTGRLETESHEGEIPESFFGNLCMTDGWFYRELP
jgi:hypothetical protein